MSTYARLAALPVAELQEELAPKPDPDDRSNYKSGLA